MEIPPDGSQGHPWIALPHPSSCSSTQPHDPAGDSHWYTVYVLGICFSGLQRGSFDVKHAQICIFERKAWQEDFWDFGTGLGAGGCFMCCRTLNQGWGSLCKMHSFSRWSHSPTKFCHSTGALQRSRPLDQLTLQNQPLFLLFHISLLPLRISPCYSSLPGYSALKGPSEHQSQPHF